MRKYCSLQGSPNYFQEKTPIFSGGFSERLPRPVPHLLVLLCVDHALLPRLPCMLEVHISPFLFIFYFARAPT